MISRPFAEPHSTHGDRRTTWISRSGGREVIARTYSRFDKDQIKLNMRGEVKEDAEASLDPRDRRTT
jgi:hypothetical protein